MAFDTHDPYSHGYPPMDGLDPIAQVVLGMSQPFIAGRAGGPLLGFGSTNMADRYRSLSDRQLADTLMLEAAKNDRDAYRRMLYGGTRHFFGEETAERAQFSDQAADFLQASTPTLAMFAPQKLDQLAGPRGSQAVFTRNFLQAAKYGIDPVTGRFGLSEDSLKSLQQGVYQGLYADDKFQERTLRAGQMGELYSTMEAMGLMPQASPEKIQRDYLSDLSAADQRMTRMRANVDPNKPVDQLSRDELQSIAELPEVGAQLRGFQTERVVSSLKEYEKLTDSLKELFGTPDAPMAQLFGKLRAMTGTAMYQMNPAQMTTMVRDLGNLTSMAGMSPEAAALMTQSSLQVARAVGLNDSFTGTISAHGVAAAIANRGNPAIWEAVDPETQMGIARDLTAGALASDSANRMGLAMRMEELTGGFAEGSKAAAYLQAIRAGRAEFTHEGQQFNVTRMMDQEIGEMIADSSGGQLTYNQVMGFKDDKRANQQYAAREPENVAKVNRGEQLQELLQSKGFGAALGAVREQLGPDASPELVHQIATQVTDDMMRLTPEERADTVKRRKVLSDSIRSMLPAELQGKAAAVTEDVWGSLMEAVPTLSGNRTLESLMATSSPESLQNAQAVMASVKARSLMQEAMRPLGRGSALESLANAIFEAGDPDKPEAEVTLKDTAMRALGLQTPEDLAAAKERLQSLPEFKKAMQQYRDAESTAKALETASPQEQANLERELKSQLESLQDSFGKAVTQAQKAGMSIADPKALMDLTSYETMYGEPKSEEIKPGAVQGSRGGQEETAKAGADAQASRASGPQRFEIAHMYINAGSNSATLVLPDEAGTA